jgi:diguanylate cyclase (GGDEF)-like protein
MDENYKELRRLFRTDTLTGMGNMIGFYERLYSRMENEPDTPFSLLSIDICDLQEVNDNFGRSAGDSTIRWFAQVILEETEGEVFRIGGDEFAVILSRGSPEFLSSMMGKLTTRLNQEASQAYLTPPVANIAVVNFNDFTEGSLVRIMGIFYDVIDKKKENRTKEFEVYEADDIPDLRGLNTANQDMIEKLARVGELLDQSLHLAYTDLISGLPNLNAALRYLEVFKEESRITNSVFSIFLIDGDNLGQYNKLSYKHGDDMIKDMGTTLKEALRPNDYIARWRSGDEFIIVLPGTTQEDVKLLEKRLRESIKEASQKWQFPITISIGVACYPRNGETVDELIDCAEEALRLAKARGKDCAVMIE